MPRYALTPWTWGSDDAGNLWVPPAACAGWIDLRPLPAQALAGGTPRGFLFGAFTEPHGGIELANVADFRAAPVTSAMQDAWEGEMGFRPGGDDLVDLLWDQLTTGADPAGDAGPKPLMPTHKSTLDLIVAGHSVVRSEHFQWGVHPHTSRVQALIRADFERQWEESNGSDHCRRLLGMHCRKYGIDDWREFVPRRLHAHVPGPLRPHSNQIDTFNGADSDTMGVDLTWTETSGDWDIASNQAVGQADGAETRAEADVDSDDHYVQAWLSASTVQPCACARFNGSARTFYFARARSVVGNIIVDLLKSAAGSRSSLVVGSGDYGTMANRSLRMENDGSNLAGYLGGVSANSTTDTAITGNTRGGLRTENGASTVDNYLITDLTTDLSVTLDADGTIAAEVADSDTDAAYFDDCNDTPDGNSSDWVGNDTSETSTTAWFSLANVPADFDSMDYAELSIDGDATGFSDDTCTLTARVYDADNDTTNPLCDETGNLLTDADSTRVQRTAVLANLTGTKAQWNSAHVRFTWTYSKSGGPDNAQVRLYGVHLEGAYSVAAGTTYDLTPSESLGLSDALARLAHGNRDLSESLAFSDTVFRIAHGNRAPSESLGLTDAVSRDVDYLRQVAESLGLTDSVTITTAGGGVFTLAPSESLGLSDSASRVAHGNRNPSESLGMSDAVARDVDYLRQVADSLALLDGFTISTAGGQVLGLTLAESLGMSDAVSRDATAHRAISDSLAVQESVSRACDILRAVEETLALTDTLSASLISAVVGTGSRPGWYYLEPGRTWTYKEPGRTWRFLE